MRALITLSILALTSALAPPVTAQPTTPDPSAKPDPFATFPKPSSDLPFLSLDKAWPDRWGRPDRIKGVIVDLDDPTMALKGSRGYNPLPADDSADATALKRGNITNLNGPEHFLYESPGSFNYSTQPPKEGEKPKARANEPVMRFKFISGELELNRQGAEIQEAVRLQRTWFSVFDPVDSARPRGTALLMPGLFGTPEGTLTGLTTSLRKRGWVVLRMMSQPSRFTERADFELNAGGDLKAQAQRIAEVFDDRAAECAYAAQAAFAHLEEKRPDLAKLPRTAIGFSGGAMTLPTVVAREEGRYAAGIMVGGGCDFWLMNQRSSYRQMIDAIHEKWDGPSPTDQDRAQLDALYLENAPLDSYHTAAALKGKPVLMIHATADLAVPAPLGDLLWERLGKPERWLQDGQGHETLFMFLPPQFDKMMDWLDKAAPIP